METNKQTQAKLLLEEMAIIEKNKDKFCNEYQEKLQEFKDL